MGWLSAPPISHRRTARIQGSWGVYCTEGHWASINITKDKMHTLKVTASSSLGLPAENYIYSIAASAPGSFAAISSDDSLRVFDAANLDRVSVISRKTHEEGVTSLRSYAAGESQLLVTGGREGTVKVWDVRTGNVVVEMETGEPIDIAFHFSGFHLLGFRFCDLVCCTSSQWAVLYLGTLMDVGEFVRCDARMFLTLPCIVSSVSGAD